MARPKRQFTDEDKAMIANYALDGGKNHTIAMALDMPVNTLTNRFTGLLKKYRAIRKLRLARDQTRQVPSSPQMAIFLGKNELNQVDKQVIATKTEPTVIPEAEQKAVDLGCKAYKEALCATPEEQVIKIRSA